MLSDKSSSITFLSVFLCCERKLGKKIIAKLITPQQNAKVAMMSEVALKPTTSSNLPPMIGAMNEPNAKDICCNADALSASSALVFAISLSTYLVISLWLNPC